MNYQIVVYYTNSTDIRRFNAETLDKAWAIVTREKAGRFVRRIELMVELQAFVVHHAKP